MAVAAHETKLVGCPRLNRASSPARTNATHTSRAKALIAMLLLMLTACTTTAADASPHLDETNASRPSSSQAVTQYLHQQVGSTMSAHWIKIQRQRT
jgi:hypothetical protein